MFDTLTLNVNGLYDCGKWIDFWKSVLKVDVLCFQEIHLIPDQIFAFQLHAQSYDWFFWLGTSKSTGFCIGVKWALGIIPNKISEILGCMILLDLNGLRIMNIYAPNDLKEHLEFFTDIEAYILENLVFWEISTQ